MNKFILLAGLICTSPAVWAQNICLSISEGTYTCVSDKKTNTVIIARGRTEDGQAAIQMTIDAQAPQTMPCLTGNKSIEFCTAAQRSASPSMARECLQKLGSKSLAISLGTASDINRLSLVLVSTYRDISNKNEIVEYANVAVSLTKTAANQFKVAAAVEGLSQGTKSKELVQGLCTKN